MSDVQLTTDATAKLARLYVEREKRLVPTMEKAMSRTAMATVADVKVRMRGGQGTNAVRSGRLRNSLGQETKVEGTIIKTLLGSMGVVYAKIQEFGGTILPKKGRYLAIPLGPAKTAAGVSKYASPRDIPGLVFLKSKSGNPILARRVGKGKRARLIPMFVLVTSVTLKPRLGLRETIKKFFAGAGSHFESEIKQGVERIFRG